MTEDSADNSQGTQEASKRRRDLLLLFLTAVAFLNLYYWIVNLQIAALPQVTVFVLVN